MAAIAIGCHHGVRCDMLSPLGHESWKDKLHLGSADENYAECVQRFFSEVIPEYEVESLMAEAGEEVLSLIHICAGGLRQLLRPQRRGRRRRAGG